MFWGIDKISVVIIKRSVVLYTRNEYNGKMNGSDAMTPLVAVDGLCQEMEKGNQGMKGKVNACKYRNG